MLPLLLLASAHAFQPTLTGDGYETRWATMPVPWTYIDEDRPSDLDEAEVRAAATGAFAVWGEVPEADVWLRETAPGAASEAINTVHWLAPWPFDPTVLAMTSTWATDDGEVIRFTIALNSQHHAWSTSGHPKRADLQNTLTHEVGHALGLDHDPVHYDATMAPTARMGETHKRDLHVSDEAGAAYLYPPGTAAPIACNSAATPSGTPLALLGLLTLFARRRPTHSEPTC